jgi:hypothetical protein
LNYLFTVTIYLFILAYYFLDRQPASHEEFCGQPDKGQRGHHTGPEGACAGAGTILNIGMFSFSCG